MEKVILKKENGVVSESVREILISSNPELTKNEQCFVNITDLNQRDYTKEEKNEARSVVYTMVHDVSKSFVGNKVIKELYNRLKVVKTNDDLLEIMNLLVKSYEKISLDNVSKIEEKTKSSDKSKSKMDSVNLFVKKFKKQLEVNPELVISIATKKIISTYYLNSLLELGSEKVNEFQNLKMNNASMENMFEFLGETFDDTAKENGVKKLSERIFSDTIDIVFDQLQTHLCWDCQSWNKCQKVDDIDKKRIGDYSFIRDGYQIWNSKNDFDVFVVTGCENFERDNAVVTPEMKKKAKEAKDALRMAYFGAETSDEAFIIQDDLIRRGELKHARGRVPDSKTMAAIRSRHNRSKK